MNLQEPLKCREDHSPLERRCPNSRWALLMVVVLVILENQVLHLRGQGLAQVHLAQVLLRKVVIALALAPAVLLLLGLVAQA